jgi:hypothetical protein
VQQTRLARHHGGMNFNLKYPITTRTTYDHLYLSRGTIEGFISTNWLASRFVGYAAGLSRLYKVPTDGSLQPTDMQVSNSQRHARNDNRVFRVSRPSSLKGWPIRDSLSCHGSFASLEPWNSIMVFAERLSSLRRLKYNLIICTDLLTVRHSSGMLTLTPAAS